MDHAAEKIAFEKRASELRDVLSDIPPELRDLIMRKYVMHSMHGLMRAAESIGELSAFHHALILFTANCIGGQKEAEVRDQMLDYFNAAFKSERQKIFNARR